MNRFPEGSRMKPKDILPFCMRPVRFVPGLAILLIFSVSLLVTGPAYSYFGKGVSDPAEVRITWLQISVKPGDSLCSLARRHLGSEGRIAEIIKANGLYEPYIILPGQVLRIPLYKALEPGRPSGIYPASEAKADTPDKPVEPVLSVPSEIAGEVRAGSAIEKAGPAIIAVAPHVIDVLLALMGNPARTAEVTVLTSRESVDLHGDSIVDDAAVGVTTVGASKFAMTTEVSGETVFGCSVVDGTSEIVGPAIGEAISGESSAPVNTGEAAVVVIGVPISGEVSAIGHAAIGGSAEVSVSGITGEARVAGIVASLPGKTPPVVQGPDLRAKIKALLGLVILILLGFLLYKLREMKRLAARGQLSKYDYENPLGKLDRFLGGGGDSKGGDGSS